MIWSDALGKLRSNHVHPCAWRASVGGHHHRPHHHNHHHHQHHHITTINTITSITSNQLPAALVLMTRILSNKRLTYPPARSHTPCANTHLPAAHASAPLQSQSLQHASCEEGKTRSQPADVNNVRGGRWEGGEGGEGGDGEEAHCCCCALSFSFAEETRLAAEAVAKSSAAALLLKLLPQR
jgi:hypothetical protein